MKPFKLFSCVLLGAAVYKLSCTPPRPRENAPLASDGGGDSTQGGTSSLPDVPDLPAGFGGALEGDAACGPGPDPSLSFSKANLLRSIAACTTQRLCEFESSAIVLSNRAEDYVDEPEDDVLESLRSAFLTAMLRWGRLEMFQFGPQASSMKDPYAGQGLRDLIYAWPNVSRCKVEEQVFGKAYESEGFSDFVDVPINSRGLFAVEYLSFFEGTDNDCSQFSIVNAEDAWNQADRGEIVRLKHAYLEGVSNDVAARAIQLHQLWAPEGQDFSADLASAAPYPDQMMALNIVAHGLLYLDKEVKDYKVGAPAGLYEGAPVQLPELPFSGGATRLLQANVEGFRDLFVGCGGEGLGFDDWLAQVGHGDLADDIVADLAAAESFVDDFPELRNATSGQLVELHEKIKAITDHLKTELFGQGSPIGLTLPTAVEGDTD